MTEYIDKEAFIKEARKTHCEDCKKRKGLKNGKTKVLYEIGDAPCKSCGIDDVLSAAEDFPASEVVGLDDGVLLGAQLAAMHGSDATSEQLEKSFWDGFEEAMKKRDVRPATTGVWEWDKDGMDWNIGAWLCSECKTRPETWWATEENRNPLRCSGSHFCGNCGAEMKGTRNG